MKTDLFQSCGHCWVFQICWHIECSTIIASSFKTWNSSTGIPSPPLDLFIVMLPKAHLTSHSRMSGSRWVITPSWLSGSWRSFCTVLLCILATSAYYPSSQGYGFSSSHVWMWELDYKESMHWRTDAFELWCWRRLLRFPWTSRRSSQSILKEITHKYSLERLML